MEGEKREARMKEGYPEYQSLEAFIEFCLEDDLDTYSHVDLQELAYALKRSSNKIRKELEEYGFTLRYREKEKQVRGWKSNDNDRWYGPGSERTHGGSGHEQINGFSGQEG